MVRLSGNMLTYHRHYLWWLPHANAQGQTTQALLGRLNLNNMLRTLLPQCDCGHARPVVRHPHSHSSAGLSIWTPNFADNLNRLHLPRQPLYSHGLLLAARVKQATPGLLIDSPERRLWYYPEHEFVLPKSSIGKL